MKLKRRLIGAVAAAAIVVPTLVTAVSCSSQKEVKLRVSYTGKRFLAPDEGVVERTLTDFTLTRELKDNEAITVQSTDAKVETEIVGGRPEGATFDINIYVSVDDRQLDESTYFDLIFTYYVDGTEVNKFSINEFTYQYSGLWAKKEVIKLDGREAFDTEPGKPRYTSSTFFGLTKGTKIKPEESLHVAIDGPQSSFFTCSAFSTEDRIDFVIEPRQIESPYEDYEQELTIVFTIKYAGTVKSTSSFDLTYHYHAAWLVPTITYEGFDTDKAFDPQEDGMQSYSFSEETETSRSFTISDKDYDRIDVTTTNPNVSVSNLDIDEDNHIWFDLDLSSLAVTDIYEDEKMYFNLRFTMSKSGFDDEVFTTDLFYFQYNGYPQAALWESDFGARHTTWRGDKLVTINGQIFQPEETEWSDDMVQDVYLSADASGTKAAEIKSTGGTTIKPDNCVPVEGSDDKNFIVYAWDNPQTGSITHLLSTFWTLERDEDKGGYYVGDSFEFYIVTEYKDQEQKSIRLIKFDYVPLIHADSDDYTTDVYADDRTLSIAFAYLPPGESRVVSEFITGWILGKDPDSDSKYYIATTWQMKDSIVEGLKYAKEEGTGYHFGVSDYSMAEKHNTEDLTNVVTDDYYFLDMSEDPVTVVTSAIDPNPEDHFIWQGDRRSIFGVALDDYGCDAAVIEIDFSKMLEKDTSYGGGNTFRNIEHGREVKNKLNRIEQYQEESTDGKRTDLLNAIITQPSSETSIEGFYAYGFGLTSITYYSQTRINAARWTKYRFDTNEIYHTSLQDMGGWIDGIISWLAGDTYKITDGVLNAAPTYQFLVKGSQTYFDGYGDGAMFLVRYEEDGVMKSKIAAIYSGNYPTQEGKESELWFEAFAGKTVGWWGQEQEKYMFDEWNN